MADFAVRLRQLRRERGLRQIDLAVHLGIAQTTIANYEQHARFPDEERLIKLAHYFEVSLDYLLGRSDVSISPNHLALYSALVRPDASTLSSLALQYFNLLKEGRRDDAHQLVLATVRRGTSVRDIYQTVIEPTLRVVGTMWESGDLDVSQEHYFSDASHALVAKLGPYLAKSREERGTVALTAAGAEQHIIGIRMVGDFLKEAGWRPYYLGGNTPTVDVHHAVTREDARVLAISATMARHVDSVTQMIDYVRSNRSRTAGQPLSVIVGGLPFQLDPELWKRTGADGFARDGQDAVDLVNRLTEGASD